MKNICILLLLFIGNSYSFFDCFKCKEGDKVISFSLFGTKIKSKPYYFDTFEFATIHLPWKYQFDHVSLETTFHIPFGPPIDVLLGPRIELFPFPEKFRIGVVAENIICV